MSDKSDTQTVRDYLELLESMLKCSEYSPALVKTARGKVLGCLDRLDKREGSYEAYTRQKSWLQKQLDRVVRTKSRDGRECSDAERLKTLVDVVLKSGAKNLYCREFTAEEMQDMFDRGESP